MNLGGAVRLNRCGLMVLVGVMLIIIIIWSSSSSSPQYFNDDGVLIIHSDSDPALLQSSFIRSNGFSGDGRVSLRSLLIASIDSCVRGGQQVVQVRKSDSHLQETIKGIETNQKTKQ